MDTPTTPKSFAESAVQVPPAVGEETPEQTVKPQARGTTEKKEEEGLTAWEWLLRLCPFLAAASTIAIAWMLNGLIKTSARTSIKVFLAENTWPGLAYSIALFFLGFVLGIGVILVWKNESKEILLSNVQNSFGRFAKKRYIREFTELGLIWTALCLAIIGFVLMIYFAFSVEASGGKRILLLSLMGSFLLTFFGYALFRLLRGKKNPTEYSIFGSLFVLILGSASFLPAMVELARGHSITTAVGGETDTEKATAQFGIVVGILVVITAGLVTSVLQQKDFSRQLTDDLDRKIKGIKGFADFMRHFQQGWAESLLRRMIQLFDSAEGSKHIKMCLCDMIDKSQIIWSRHLKVGWNQWYSHRQEMDRMDRLKKIISNAEKSVYALTYDFESYITEFWGTQKSEQYVTVNSNKHDIVKRIFVIADDVFSDQANGLSPEEGKIFSEKRSLLKRIFREHRENHITVRILYLSKADKLLNSHRNSGKVPTVASQGPAIQNASNPSLTEANAESFSWQQSDTKTSDAEYQECNLMREVITSFLICDDCVVSEPYFRRSNDSEHDPKGPGYIKISNTYDERREELIKLFEKLERHDECDVNDTVLLKFLESPDDPEAGTA